MQIGDAPPPVVEEDPVVDDEEVAFAMAQMRREAGRMRSKAIKNNHALELARRRAEVKVEEEEEEEELPPAQKADEEGEDGRISSLDETSQFIRNLGVRREEEEARRAKAESVVAPVKTETDAPLVEMEDLPEDVEMRSGEDDEAGADEEAEMARLMAGDEAKANDEEGVTSGETYVAGGMAATLSILKQQGLLKPMTPEERERERLYQQKQAWQAEQRRKDALRDLEREQARKGGPTSAKDQAQREYENRQREAAAARETARAFESYKPVVDIKYHDDFGRQLDPKEAWKALSHKFHGKGSGKLKTEKRIKKIEEQKKMVSLIFIISSPGSDRCPQEAMTSGDTPTGTNEAFRKRQEMVGSATMILSVGNKGSAPQQEEFLASLAKPKKEKAGAAAGGKGKGKANKAGTPSATQDLMMGLGAATASLPGSGSATPMLPRKAAGFKPIAARAVASPSGVDSPAPGTSNGAEGSATPKVSIGLTGKRKAEEEAEGSPSAKRVA